MRYDAGFQDAPYGTEPYECQPSELEGTGLKKVAAFFYPPDSAAPYPALQREDGKVLYLSEDPSP